MFYDAYQAQQDILAPFQGFARGSSRLLRQFDEAVPGVFPLRHWAAMFDILGGARTTHERPPFGFTSVQVDGESVAVTEETVHAMPFGTLLRFRKDTKRKQTPVLLVAPMSGHFATLLRGTVATMLPDYDVHITDWHNAREVPVSAGSFGFDGFVAHITAFLRAMGPGAHVVAVCQPAVPVLATAALMAEERDPTRPRSLTLMAGPIDTRVNPTSVNELATSRPISWFEQHLISTVPWRFAGAGRRVYPGVLQLTAFLNMNMDRHVKAYADQFRHLVSGEEEAATAHRRFYDEYLAVMDLPAEFYLETVKIVFQDHSLPLGKLTVGGRLVRPELIQDMSVLTVEAERDDICSVGQTAAALDLCSGLPAERKRNHVQKGVGHYGVFNGRRWSTEIYPMVRETIESANRAAETAAA
ncbi:polyhydroxyalkanoate depolymerase [Roseomonas gilardii]|uniref:polyhydroxyalkanoate depolymerase n=1 Tax=Roseomonas gilardii TaxID=257708 RepID=UPI000480803F|nr:polyhydroxyalkanoate depolymerase [Roseomonas gilardii]SUE44514.1 Poly-beta-hydroxyalkanoate depolymerase [Roseomonas gilardii subsp. rosea]